jgi:hypothetical protein
MRLGGGIQIEKKRSFFLAGSGIIVVTRAQRKQEIKLLREEVVVRGGMDEKFFLL